MQTNLLRPNCSFRNFSTSAVVTSEQNRETNLGPLLFNNISTSNSDQFNAFIAVLDTSKIANYRQEQNKEFKEQRKNKKEIRTEGLIIMTMIITMIAH